MKEVKIYAFIILPLAMLCGALVSFAPDGVFKFAVITLLMAIFGALAAIAAELGTWYFDTSKRINEEVRKINADRNREA